MPGYTRKEGRFCWARLCWGISAHQPPPPHTHTEGSLSRAPSAELLAFLLLNPTPFLSSYILPWGLGTCCCPMGLCSLSVQPPEASRRYIKEEEECGTLGVAGRETAGNRK